MGTWERDGVENEKYPLPSEYRERGDNPGPLVEGGGVEAACLRPCADLADTGGEIEANRAAALGIQGGGVLEAYTLKKWRLDSEK